LDSSPHHQSVAEPVAAIQQYLEHHNADPKPFV
jgi:hypothetical protein